MVWNSPIRRATSDWSVMCRRQHAVDVFADEVDRPVAHAEVDLDVG